MLHFISNIRSCRPHTSDFPSSPDLFSQVISQTSLWEKWKRNKQIGAEQSIRRASDTAAGGRSCTTLLQRIDWPAQRQMQIKQSKLFPSHHLKSHCWFELNAAASQEKTVSQKLKNYRSETEAFMNAITTIQHENHSYFGYLNKNWENFISAGCKATLLKEFKNSPK